MVKVNSFQAEKLARRRQPRKRSASYSLVSDHIVSKVVSTRHYPDWSSNSLGLFFLFINAIVSMTTNCTMINQLAYIAKDCIVVRVDGRRRRVRRIGLYGSVQMAAQGRTRLLLCTS
jgi:hypothetical protein